MPPLLGVRTHRVGFLPAFDVTQGASTSGYVPAQCHYETCLCMGGEFRLWAAHAALERGIAEKLVIVGRAEPRVPDASQAHLIARMLTADYHVPIQKLGWVCSPHSGTDANAICIAGEIRTKNLSDCAVISNYYHLPRLLEALGPAHLKYYVAEALWLADAADRLQHARRVEHLTLYLGKGPHALRCLHEIIGIAAKYTGTYRSSYAC